MTVELKVNGKAYSGWTSAVIKRSIEQLASSFALNVTDKWMGRLWRINPGDSCQVSYSGHKIITGYVDSVQNQYDAENHTINISGRSKVADLVDCSLESKQYRNLTFSQIATDICSPFGVSVTGSGSVLVPDFKSDEGAFAFEALEKLARLHGVLLTDNPNGDLVIGATPVNGGKLELGKNILSGSVQFDYRGRFSSYQVKGQSRGTDDQNTAITNQVSFSESDNQVTRYRPLILSAEDQASLTDVKRRAVWEKNNRWGQSQSFVYTVQDWLLDGKLIEPNQLIHVEDELAGISQRLLAVSVEYRLDDAGTVSEITLAPQEGYQIAPITKPKTTNPKKKGTVEPTINWDLLG